MRSFEGDIGEGGEAFTESLMPVAWVLVLNRERILNRSWFYFN